MSERNPLPVVVQVAQHELRIAALEEQNDERKRDMRATQRELKRVFWALILLLSSQVPGIAAVLPELVKKYVGH